MNPVVKTVLGSASRHWLGALLAVLLVKHGIMQPDQATNATAQLTDDMASDLLLSLGGALLPIVWSIWSRLMLKLRERVALLSHAGADEHDVKRMISDMPLGHRIKAMVTSDPTKLTGVVGGAAHKAEQPNE